MTNFNAQEIKTKVIFMGNITNDSIYNNVANSLRLNRKYDVVSRLDASRSTHNYNNCKSFALQS